MRSAEAQQASAATPPAASPSAPNMEFSDNPDFRIAGVTDWTAVGGHGSDATLRTSEDLARETLALKSRANAAGTMAFSSQEEAHLLAALAAAPADYRTSHALGEYYLQTGHYREAIAPLETASRIRSGNTEDERDLALACGGLGDWKQARRHVEDALAHTNNPDLHRLAGDIDEQSGDSLAAVRQDEQAARLSPSEDNYFAWASELLLHRAVWQAAEVFKQGTTLYPASARMRTGWGSALFAGALYDQAAQQLCTASDLAPAQTDPYLLLGKVEVAAPTPLPCVDEKLMRFVQTQPANADANYLYAIALLRKADTKDPALVEQLLTKTATLDPRYAAAYLQLGILAFAARNSERAIRLYRQAITADPQLAEAHYRLAMAYDRLGNRSQAAEELQTHDQLAKTQADAVEQQRRSIKQFSIASPDPPAGQKQQE